MSEIPIQVENEPISFGGGGAVNSVNGMTGDVVLDIPSKTSELANDNNFQTGTQVIQAVGQETTAREAANTEIHNEIDVINGKIPAQATRANQLADKNFVNSSISTNTAYYISNNGQPFQSLAELEAYSGVLTNNDYAFVVGVDSEGNTTYTRYKYSSATQEWAQEYILNNSSFTADQWAAITSGITSGLVEKLKGIEDGAEVNVQSDWDEDDTTAPEYIKNKPTPPADFVGTDGQTAGTHGLVPAPAATDAGKYLKADGTWDSVQAGPTVVQTIGTSTTDVMSQNAVRNMIYQPNTSSVPLRAIQIGDGTHYGGTVTNGTPVAIGYNAAVAVSGGNTGSGVAIGGNTQSSHNYAVALGYGSVTGRINELSVGGGNSLSPIGGVRGRYIANVLDPQLAHDAATKNYVDNFYPVGTVYTSTSATAPTFAGGTWTEIGTQEIGSKTVHYYERTA